MKPAVVKVQVEPDSEIHRLLAEAYEVDPETTVHITGEADSGALRTSLFRHGGRAYPTRFPYTPGAWLAAILGSEEGFLFALGDRSSIDLVLIAPVGGRRRRYEGSYFFHDEVQATMLVLRPAPTRPRRDR